MSAILRRAGVAALLCAIAPVHAAGDEAAELEALSAPGIAGEILDTAVRHCQRGESEQAAAMFRAIREQLEPPPGILKVVAELEASGCRPPWMEPGTWKLQLGGGYDSNVSQGISARSLVIGSGADAIELALDDSFRPRSSAYVQATADYATLLPFGSGVRLQLGAGHRANLQQSRFDLSTLSASATREFQWARGVLRAQVDHAEVWLAGRHYQRVQGVSGQMIWPQAKSDGVWLATGTVRSIAYMTQAAQNSWQFEAGLLREQRLGGGVAIFGGVSLQHDDATRGRPGGDRTGAEFQLGGALPYAGWQVRPFASYARWTSAQAFAPGLLDDRRHNQLLQVVVQAEKPLGPQTSLLLEWRSRWSRDTVALYSYTAHALGASVVRRF